jgi:HD-GYP domain-containing protein (c-di-GMP phosphodiesterase class II)
VTVDPTQRPLPKLEWRFREFLDELDRCEGYVPGHSVAVCRLALRLARALDVSEDDLPALALGALMHDVGKVFVDSSLLGKEAALTPAEIDIIRLHPQLGEALLAENVAHPIVLGVVRWHHERWDGGGYPDGLQGSAIPLPARIVAAADAFTAMSERRAYRRARRPDEAVGEMCRLAGRQFDGACVEALVEGVDRPKPGRKRALRTLRQGVQAL